MKDLLEEKTDDTFVIISKILAVKISKLLNENVDKQIEVYYDYYTSKRIYYHCYSKTVEQLLMLCLSGIIHTMDYQN